MRQKKKKVERENVEFRQRGYRNSSTQFCCPGVRCVWSAQSEKKKKNFDKLIVAMPLSKQGKKIFCNNCGNGIAENGEKKSGSEIWGGVKKKNITFTIFSQ